MGLALAGRRVLTTRMRGQASGLVALLEEQGAVAIQIPTIELVAPESWCGLDAALASIRSYDWLLFTSANAVYAYVERARVLGVMPQARRVAVIGPATARAVRESGLAAEVDLMAERYVAEGLAEALAPHARGASMLLVRAAEARDVLPEALVAAGAEVTIAAAYRTVVPAGSGELLRELFLESPPDAITFTSASTVRNMEGLMAEAGVGMPEGVVLASIGPITSGALREMGMRVTVEAGEATMERLVGALVEYFGCGEKRFGG